MRNVLWPLALIVVACMTIQPANAWDCSNPVNRTLNVPGNECYVAPSDPTPQRTPGRPINRQEQSNEQTQGQGQTANGGIGNGGTGGAGGSGYGGSGGQGGNAYAAGGISGASTATNAGNSQSTSYASTLNVPRQAVDGYSTGTNSTASCVRDQHAGIGAVIGGLSFGRGKRDSDCARQALATQLWARGEVNAGNLIYCQITEVKAALGADCIALVNERTYAPENAVTQDQLRETERRIVGKMVQK
jgi:hypothetical protein